MIRQTIDSLAVAVVLAVSAPSAARAQALSTPLLPVSPGTVTPMKSLTSVDLALRDATSPRPSYWWQGGLIGTAVFVGAVAWLTTIGDSQCRDGCGVSRRTVILAAIPVGFITGALIGGNIHPHQSETAPPSQ